MKDIDLQKVIVEFIELQDGDYSQEWYCSPREMAVDFMRDFATHLGMELDIPEYVPDPKNHVDRAELMAQLLPEIEKMFGVTYKKYTEAK